MKGKDQPEQSRNQHDQPALGGSGHGGVFWRKHPPFVLTDQVVDYGSSMDAVSGKDACYPGRFRSGISPLKGSAHYRLNIKAFTLIVVTG